ncbi:hypothetical protein JHW43_003057 [Diplocarpon mali]|nr:hypothetical protein JHW43_003057 [Diplocarpon mali]
MPPSQKPATARDGRPFHENSTETGGAVLPTLFRTPKALSPDSRTLPNTPDPRRGEGKGWRGRRGAVSSKDEESRSELKRRRFIEGRRVPVGTEEDALSRTGQRAAADCTASQCQLPPRGFFALRTRERAAHPQRELTKQSPPHLSGRASPKRLSACRAPPSKQTRHSTRSTVLLRTGVDYSGYPARARLQSAVEDFGLPRVPIPGGHPRDMGISARRFFSLK